jgi:hypothetical protein
LALALCASLALRGMRLDLLVHPAVGGFAATVARMDGLLLMLLLLWRRVLRGLVLVLELLRRVLRMLGELRRVLLLLSVERGRGREHREVQGRGGGGRRAGACHRIQLRAG